MAKLPKGFRQDPDTAELRCPHRDLTCCKNCAEQYGLWIVESYGVHYWMTAAERADWEAFLREQDDEEVG